MKRMAKLTTTFAMLSMLILFTGCSTDVTESSVDELYELIDYLTANGMDLPALLTGWITTAENIFNTGTENFYIIDIRSAADFALGHVPGAVNVVLADVVTHEATNNAGALDVIVVCYTGQSAGHAVTALRLNDVSAQVMKWGMSGWHSDFDKWSANTGDAVEIYGGWSTEASPATATFDYPILDTGNEDGVDIMDYQIDNAILDGFNGITNETVLQNFADYQIINYWDAVHWDYYGHITGAYQVETGTLDLDLIEMLDPATPIVVYCWTGQTASIITAWLNLLGYEAYDLKFSANGMIYKDLEVQKWSAADIPNYDFETGS